MSGPIDLASINLVIFDCDGVLVDSERISNEVLAEVLEEHGVRLTWQEAMKTFVGQSVEGVRLKVAGRFGVEMPTGWATDYYARMIPALSDRVEPIAGARDVVGSVRAAGLRYCVASQGPMEKIRATLSRVGLWDDFDGAIFSAKSVARPKPAPDLFLFAAAQMGVPPERCIVIEDSATGVAAAIAAEMRVLAYCPDSEWEVMRQRGAIPFDRMGQVPVLLGITD